EGDRGERETEVDGIGEAWRSRSAYNNRAINLDEIDRHQQKQGSDHDCRKIFQYSSEHWQYEEIEQCGENHCASGGLQIALLSNSQENHDGCATWNHDERETRPKLP